MSKVKQEVTDSDDDTWLSYWANPDREVKAEKIKEELDIKPEIKDEQIIKPDKIRKSVKQPIVVLKRLPNFLTENSCGYSCKSNSLKRKLGPVAESLSVLFQESIG